jgi:hypothetical protein
MTGIIEIGPVIYAVAHDYCVVQVLSFPLKLILWILTGFGGGTVFCIEGIFKKYDIRDKLSIDISENYGHILGLVAGIVIFNVFKVYEAPIIFSALRALSVALLTINFAFKSTKESESRA